MKLFSLIPKKQELKNKIRETLTRFPVAGGISIIVTLLFFILIAVNLSNTTTEIITKLIMSWVVTFFLSVWITLYRESIEKTSSYIFVWHVFSIVFWGLFYYFLSPDINGIEIITFFLLTLFWVISLLFSAPYLKYIKHKKYKESWYYVYFYKISTVLFMSLIVWWALTLGWGMAILAIELLFDIWGSVLGDVFGYWTSLSLALITPLFALSELPKKWEFENSKFNENVFFNFLIRYIAIPFIYVYFFILYAYTIKVLLNFSDWPKGEVSWMVIGFSLFWYIVYMFSYIFETKKDTTSQSLIAVFRKYFPLVVLPQIGMLFYAIFLRIGQYDITMNRYFVVVFGLWLLVTSLYLILSKSKSILYIPTILTLFTLIISIGPWSVYNLPLIRQTARLEENLLQANILQHHIDAHKIIPLKKYSDIDKNLSHQIYDGIEYVCSFDNCKNIKQLFPKIYWDFLTQDTADFDAWIGKYKAHAKNKDIKYDEPNKWEIVSHITETIKVQKDYSWRSDYHTVYFSTSDSIYPLDIEWYYIIDQFNSNQDNTYNIDIESIYNTLQDIYKETWNTKLSSPDNNFPIETDTYTWKLILESASIYTDPYSEKIQKYLHGILLLKKK